MAKKQRQSGGRREEASRETAGAERGERLQKVLAAAGLGSRRDCEQLITEGRVEVDGRVASELGVRVNPEQQEIRVDGTRIASPKRRYYLVNKPTGVVCTNHDPAGRTRVVDLVDSDERLFPIGRLDRSSEGMILLTNDGEFANRIAHPRYGVAKTYRVLVAGQPRPEDLQKLMKGVYLSDGVARATAVHVKKKHRESTELEIVLNEGKNREIRRVLARIGHKVLRLKRTAIGELKLGDLPTGAARRLTPQEVRALHRETEPGGSAKRGSRSSARADRSAADHAPSGRRPPVEAKRQGTVLGSDPQPATGKAPAKRDRSRRAASGRPAGQGQAKSQRAGKRPARGRSKPRRSGGLPE